MNERVKHIPMRMCAVTKEKLPKRDLVRFVNVEGKIMIDDSGKYSGRGVNIKPELEVLEKAFKTKAFERGLKVKIEDTKELVSEFEKYIEKEKKSESVGNVVRVSLEDLNKLVSKKSG